MNGDELAYPLHLKDAQGYRETHFGLSKREAFAMAAMQGLLSNPSIAMRDDEIALRSRWLADALLAQLERAG